MRGAGAMTLAAIAACASPRPAPRRAGDPVVYRRHPFFVNVIPFGAGQLQNGERTTGVALAIAEGATAATSAGIWLYLEDHYDRGLVPPDEALHVRHLQQIEIGTGVAFLALATAGIVDAIVHYQPRVEIAPMLTPDGGGVSLMWSR